MVFLRDLFLLLQVPEFVSLLHISGSRHLYKLPPRMVSIFVHWMCMNKSHGIPAAISLYFARVELLSCYISPGSTCYLAIFRDGRDAILLYFARIELLSCYISSWSSCYLAVFRHSRAAVLLYFARSNCNLALCCKDSTAILLFFGNGRAAVLLYPRRLNCYFVYLATFWLLSCSVLKRPSCCLAKILVFLRVA